MTIRLTQSSIDYEALVEGVRRPGCGAVVLFLGTVRDVSQGRAVASLDYEAYPAMAQEKLCQIAEQAKERWPLEQVSIVHRYGHLELGEIAIAVVTASAHRTAAFEAGQWLMDTIKQVVPIWKRENWQDGTSDWSHPDSAAGPAKDS